MFIGENMYKMCINILIFHSKFASSFQLNFIFSLHNKCCGVFKINIGFYLYIFSRKICIETAVIS